MKKQKKLSKILTSILAAVNILTFASFITADAVGEMNIDTVFVTDSSGSMKSSDENRIAEEAAKLIIDLCDNESCSAGLVVYGGKVTNKPELISLDNQKNVNNLKKNIENVQYNENDTNISLGIEKGYELLSESRKKENNKNPMMILLTDGRTDIDNLNPTLTQKAQDYIMEVISNNTSDDENITNIPIYTIGLHPPKKGDEKNPDDILDMETLKNIADKTGGISFEANTADDLPDIVMTIFQNYNNIKPSETTPFVQTDVPKNFAESHGLDGDIYCYKADFKVENDSIKYTNVVITHLNSNVLYYEITVPNSKLKMNHESNSDILASNSSKYTSIKMNPKAFDKDGNWTIYVYTDKAAEMSIKVMNTYDLYVEQSLNASEIKTGENLKIDAILLEDGQQISDEKLLMDIDSNENLRKAYIIDKNTGVQVEEVTLQRTEGSKYSGEITLNNVGYYEIFSTLGSANFSKTSGKSYVNVFDKSANAKIELELSAEKICIGDSLNFTAKMYDNNKTIINPENKTAELEISGAETKTIPMITDIEDGCFKLKYTPETKGYFNAVARIKDDGKSSNSVSFSVLPKAPVSKTHEVKKYTVSTGIFGFFETNETEILSDIFEWDSESDIEVAIDIGKADFADITAQKLADDYEISIKAINCGQTEASIKITDTSTGKSSSVVISVEAVNWYDPFVIPAIAVTSVIILIILIIIFGGAKLKGQKINMTLILSEEHRRKDILEPAMQSFNLPKGKKSVNLKDIIQNNRQLFNVYKTYNDKFDFDKITASINFKPYNKKSNYKNGVAIKLKSLDKRILTKADKMMILNSSQTIEFETSDGECRIIINHEK